MISVHRFYRLAIWMPILFSALAMIGAAIVGLPTFDPLNLVVTSLIVSGAYGGVPYSLLALWVSRRMRGKSEREIRRLALLMPVWMLLAFVPVAILAAASDGDTLLGGVFWILIATPYILVLGYAYVGLVFLLRFVAQSREWISTPPVSTA
jgi:hypothetical protein